MTGNHCLFQVGFGKLYFFLYCSPYTGDGNWTNRPGVLPHDVVLRKIVARCEVVGGPLTRSAWRAGELISQVFMRLAGCADPAAVLAWEIKTARCDRFFFFEKKALLLCMLPCRVDKKWPFPLTCLHFLHLVAFTGVAALRSGRHLSGPANQITAQAQALCPLSYWHVAVTIAGVLVAEDVVSAHAVPLGIKPHHGLAAQRRKRG